MNKSGRRVLRTTAAVLGMSALGVVGSGTAFASTVTPVDPTTDSYGSTDHAPADEAAGLPTDSVSGTDLHSFEMPSLADRNVKRASDSDTSSFDDTSDDASDAKGADSKSDDSNAKDDGSSKDDLTNGRGGSDFGGSDSTSNSPLSGLSGLGVI